MFDFWKERPNVITQKTLAQSTRSRLECNQSQNKC